MSTMLRKIVESKKEFYVKKIVATGMYQASELSEKNMTLTELEQVYESYQNIKKYAKNKTVF